MDLDTIEGMNEIRPSVYRTAMKLLSLQKLCHLDEVLTRHVMAAVQTVGGNQRHQEVILSKEEVTEIVKRMFDSVSQDIPGHVTDEAMEEARELLLKTFDQSGGGFSTMSLQIVLIALSSDHLINKYTALLAICKTSSGSGSGLVSRSGLRSLLSHLSQVPEAVQEGAVFGGVAEAVSSCFEGVVTSAASMEHVMSWLKSEPRLLLWLPTLYRLSVSQNVRHNVRCHTCRTSPITGLRYRCLKCANVHVCQNCFLSQRQSRKHKKGHPLMEYCTPVTWTESLSSMVRRARLTMLPRRRTQRGTNNRKWAETEEPQDRDPPIADTSLGLAGAADHHTRDPSPICSPSTGGDQHPRCSSKGQQTDEDTPTQQVGTESLMSDITNLQRDKWLLEQQMRAWRYTVQSEHSVLEDRCSQMEVTVETLKQQNLSLQGSLSQALTKMETAHTPQCNIKKPLCDFATPLMTPDPEEEQQSPTIQQGTPPMTFDYNSPSPTIYCETLHADSEPEQEDHSPSPTIHWGRAEQEEESSENDRHLSQPTGEEQDAREEDEEECSPEELVQRSVDRLKTQLDAQRLTSSLTAVKQETDVTGWREDDSKWVGLVDAAEQVGGAVHLLVDAVTGERHQEQVRDIS